MATPPILYHGTSAHCARKIVSGGFKRARRASYTGTATNLSESLTIAWEYGDPFGRGAVLRVRLKPETRWEDSTTAARPGGATSEAIDSVFAEGQLDALRTYGGNVWLLWNGGCAEYVELLAPDAALQLLASEIVANGPSMGYNADVQDYSAVIWGEKPSQTADWYLTHLRQCAARLAGVFDVASFWASRGIRPAIDDIARTVTLTRRRVA